MNYLAHLYLSDGTSAGLTGGLLGDFMHGVDLSTFPADVREGVLRHRAIDAFTDAHPVARRSRSRISPAFSRFSGILIDVFYDHFLARHWARFSDQPLLEFSRQVYAALWEHEAVLPPRLRSILARMAEQNWLTGYAEVENIGRALAGLERRLRRASNLSNALDELTRQRDTLEADFLEFFPQLQKLHLPPTAYTDGQDDYLAHPVHP